jgi:hypothetical protein
MTAKKIILAWLEAALSSNDGRVVIQTSHLHDNVRSWAKKRYDKAYSATNYERRWRELRERPRTMLQNRGIFVHNVSDQSTSRQSTWLIQRSKVPFFESS